MAYKGVILTPTTPMNVARVGRAALNFVDHLERRAGPGAEAESLVIRAVVRTPDGGRGGAGRLLRVKSPTLFETPFASNQMRLFGLAETLGDDGWLKAVMLEDYAPRRGGGATALQGVLFPYLDAL